MVKPGHFFTTIFLILGVVLASPGLADKVAFLNAPDDIFRSKMEIIDGARSGDPLFLQDFLFRDDEGGLMKLAALIDAAERGVPSRNIVDAMHLMIHPAYLKAAMDAGVDFKIWNPPSALHPVRTSKRFHAKIVGTRSKYQAGGTNTGNEYFGLGAHTLKDRDVVVGGKSWRTAYQTFNEVWGSDLSVRPSVRIASEAEVKAQRARQARGRERVRAIMNKLRKMGQDDLEPTEAAADTGAKVRFEIELDSPDVFPSKDTQLITAEELAKAKNDLREARSRWKALKLERGWTRPKEWFDPRHGSVEVQYFQDPPRKGKLPGLGSESYVVGRLETAHSPVVISSPYLVISPRVKAALKNLVRKGIPVTVLTNSFASSDNKMTQAAYEMRIKEIAALGIDLYEFNGPETLHTKTYIIGDTVSATAFNLDYRSELHNIENGVEVRSAVHAQEQLANIYADIQNSRKVASGGRLLVEKSFCPNLFARMFLKTVESQL